MKSKTGTLGERFIAAFLAVSPEGQAAIFRLSRHKQAVSPSPSCDID
jgi:hypothetical protein